MPYYNTCPHCGSHLDPGERCDCQDNAKKPGNQAESEEQNDEHHQG